MRTGKVLRRGIIAVLLGLGLAVPVPPGAAAAARTQVSNDVDYGNVIDVLATAAQMGRDGRYTPQEINQLVQQVIAAINGTKSDLLGRLNTQVTNEILGQTEAAVTKVELLKVPWAAGAALDSMHNAAYAAKRHLGSVRGSDTSLDAVGRAVITLFTLLDTAYIVIDADEGTSLAPTQRPYFRQALEHLIEEMHRECPPSGNPNHGVITYSCSFGGRTVHAEYYPLTDTHRIDGGPVTSGPITADAVAEILMRDTALPLAREALDVLIRQGVPLP